MSEETRACTETGCNGNCSSCASNPQNGAPNPESFLEPANPYNSIKKVIGVVSGKGGVGKSLVTSLLAVLMNRKGYAAGILDADITGPSIPKMFGINRRARSNDLGVLPERTANDIAVMSINLLLEQADQPVIWRGPILAGAVKQFWTDVLWGDLDFLFIDMPPGTGDVPLTVFQSIPLDGIVIVTSPQELVSLIVKKAYNMAKQMNIPILGVVENMSYVKCPGCGESFHIFGKSRLDETAAELGLEVLGRMPVDPQIPALSDKGEFERYGGEDLQGAADRLEAIFS
ncbi:MAG: Mrp/NBP35 family ATP-binding protein [Clostridiales bacterium]|nr:Mrp/NBP35 family ATP-binding protein [Clostridiales bacterium]